MIYRDAAKLPSRYTNKDGWLGPYRATRRFCQAGRNKSRYCGLSVSDKRLHDEIPGNLSLLPSRLMPRLNHPPELASQLQIHKWQEDFATTARLDHEEMMAAVSEVKSTQAIPLDLMQSKMEENNEMIRRVMSMMQDVCIDCLRDFAAFDVDGYSSWPKIRKPLNKGTTGFQRIYGNSNVNLGNFSLIFILNLGKLHASGNNQSSRQMSWTFMMASTLEMNGSTSKSSAE